VEQTREWLRRARRVAVLTGAGVSAESGVPTFRGKDGLWKHYRPEDLATPDAFLRDPRLVWQWYNWRRGLVAHAQPNRGHYALADLERLAIEFTLITQNVDDLHEQAGSTNVVKLHGDIWLVRCLSCAREWIDTRPAIAELPPRCCCGGLLRPGVIWFGEELPAGVWARAEEAARNADLFLVIGTSAVVYPAAGLVRVAKCAGAKVVEINLAETVITSQIDAFLPGPCGELLPKLIA
jgi:NAD-dependent deacetylase